MSQTEQFRVLTKAIIIRSSYRDCSIKIVAVKNFAKLTGKDLYHSLLFDNVVG